MSTSWRLLVERKDRSGTSIADTGVTGAMVVRASKGAVTPTKITVGNETQITDLFGYPSATYPDIWEAIEFNQVADIWISAPSPVADTMGGVAVLDSGVVALGTGLTIAELDTYTFTSLEHTVTDDVATGDGVETDFTFTVPFSIDDPTSDLDIKVDGVSLDSLSITGTTPTYTITATELTSGSYNSTTKLLTLVFASAVALGEDITIEYVHSAIPYFLVLSRSPMTDDLAISSTYDLTNGWWDLDIFKKSSTTYTAINTTSYTVSNDIDATDGFGASIYIENILEDNDFIIPLLNSTSPTMPDAVANVVRTDFTGGARTASTSTEWALGWNEFKSADKYPAELFMDATCDPSVPPLIENIVNNYQPYSYGGIVSLPLGTSPSTAVATKSALGLSTTDIAVYYNQGKVTDNYNGSYFWTPLVGRIGQRYALMSDIYFAGAPYQSNEGIHGGQLGSGIVELEQSLSESELQEFDEGGLNPLSFKPAFGVMIESMKTTQSTAILSDYSYIAHRNLFNYIIKNVISNALVPQIGKLNDDIHQSQAKTRADLIVNPILEDGFLQEVATVCDASNNTDAVKAVRNFMLDVVVQVTPYSERVTLRFTNTDQTTSVQAFV